MTDGDDETALTMDTAFDLLSNARRRFTLYYLSEQDGEVPLSDIAAQIAAWENDVAVDELSDAQRKRTYVSLYQTHLPKLTEAGVIRFDRERSVVELAPDARELTVYLPDDDTGHPWPIYYLAFAVGSAVVYSLVVYEIVSFGAVPDTAIGGVLIAGFGVLALAHYVLERWMAGGSYARMVPE